MATEEWVLSGSRQSGWWCSEGAGKVASVDKQGRRPGKDASASIPVHLMEVRPWSGLSSLHLVRLCPRLDAGAESYTSVPVLHSMTNKCTGVSKAPSESHWEEFCIGIEWILLNILKLIHIVSAFYFTWTDAY